MERRNKPTVGLVNRGFLMDFKSAASSRGWPTLRVVPETVPSECAVAAQAEAGVNAALKDITNALTKPLTADEKSPKPKAVEKTSGVCFKGNLEEVSRFFYRRGWTDGLPIVPPTEEAVAEMLKGTDLPADHLVAELVPRLGKATVEKIATNALMAGALPTYMPLLITSLQALQESGYFRGLAVSAGSWAPCYLVNGPIRKDLHINSGSGVMSPGDMANAAIGRTMGLIVKNIGGIRKGIEDMGTMGNPGKYTLVIAENEEESPWEPLQIQQGFDKKDSTVSVFFPCSLLQTVVYGTNDDAILRTLAYNIPPARRGTTCFLITPTHAKALASNGWRKEDIIDFICEYARAPLSHLPYFWGANLSMPAQTVKGMAGRKGMLLHPKDSPNESAPIISNPDLLRLVVTGGAGGDIGILMGGGQWITKKIDLPSNWDKLVEKYENIVPVYALY